MKHIYLIILALLFSIPAKSQINLNEGLVGHYSFGGNTNDISSKGNHATNYGGTFIGDGSVNSNQAIKFNGIDQYAEIENKEAFANSVYSISAYVNARNLDNILSIFSTFYYEESGKYWGYNLRIIYNKLQIANLPNGPWGVNESLYSNTLLNTNEYYHLVVTYDGDYAKIYINSELDATGQLPQPEFNSSTKKAHIGAKHTAGGVLGRFFNGVIDELRVYNRVLNQSEINHLYKECESVVDLQDGLTAYYPFNGNANNEADTTYHGTPTNEPSLTSDRISNSNSAYHFDGVDDYIHFNPDSCIIETTEFTISLWAKMDGQGGGNSMQNALFQQRDNATGTTSAIVFTADNGSGDISLAVRGAGSSSNNVTSPRMDYGQWHHYLGIVDGNSLKVYVDGKLTNSAEFTTSTNYTSGIDHISIGKHTYSGVNYGLFNGDIDEVRIYNRALSDKEIEQLYYKTIRSEFKASITIEDLANPVHFTDMSKSKNTISSWQWDFNNDGIIDSEEQNPTYTYDSVGTYDVKLLISDGTHTDSILKHNYINIVNPKTGLLRYYNLDNNLADTSGNNMDATATENTFTYKNGIANSCYYTDLNSRIDVPSIGNWGNHIAISFWFYGNASENNVVLFGSRQNGSGATLTNIGCFLHSDSTLRFFVASDATDEPDIYSSGKIKPYQWNHVVCIQNREINKIEIILNGVSDAATYTQSPRYKNYPIGFGGWNSGFSSTGNFTGRIDDIRIYNRELSAEEVNYLLNQEFETNADNEIIAEYEFVGNANDLSGNEFNGTIYGAELSNDRFDNLSNAYYFNSSETNYIDLGNDLKPDTLPIFVSAWIKIANISGEQVILRNDIWDATSYYAGIIIKNKDGKISAAYGDALGNTSDNYYEKTTNDAIIGENKWHHVVVGFIDSMNIAIYVDNQEIAGLYSGNITNLSYKNYHGAIGIGSGETHNFNGLIDDIRFYNRYFDPLEINEIFNSTDKYFPQIQASKTELDFDYAIVDEISDEQTFQISGTYLDGNVLLKAPEGFEISTTSGSNFDTILTITPEYATLETTTIYSRFTPAEISDYTGDITINSANLTELLISLFGNGVSTGITKYASTDLSIYPNPSNGSFNIELPVNQKNMIRVFDLCGRVVFVKNYENTDGIIHLNLNEKPGIYLLEISSEENKLVKKIIIK